MASTKKMQALVVAAVAALALCAVGVSSASASIVNAKFSSSSFKLTPSGVTIKRGTEAKSCSPGTFEAFVSEGKSFIGTNEGSGGTRFTCTDLTALVMRFLGEAKYDTVAARYYLHVLDYPGIGQQSPWGQYFQSTSETDNWTWVNGSGTTPSTITLNEQWVGYLTSTGQHITVSGTFTAKTPAGGLITLSH